MDALIQRSIREEFGDSTPVVISHRLSTIADFDRILVLSDDRIAKYGMRRELWEARTARKASSALYNIHAWTSLTLIFLFLEFFYLYSILGPLHS